jgi:hypothetical protein
MPKSSRTFAALIGTLSLLTSISVRVPVASAAPITVNLRVEGSTSTLFEGPVTTDGITSPPGIATATSSEPHPCDVKDNGEHAEGFGNTLATPTAALYAAALSHGLAFDAKWYSSFNDFEVSQVGSDINGGAPEYPSWGYAVNYTTAGVGGCQFQLAAGSEVLWAYNYFNLSQLLSLSGPASVNAGTPFTVHVTDGQTGQPVAGAAIGALSAGVTSTSASSPTTDAEGNAIVTLTQTGTDALKAVHAGSVRSNGLAVCVHNGNDGSCGTSVGGGSTTVTTTTTTTTSGGQTVLPKSVEVARVLGIRSNHTYAPRHAPRLLGGVVTLSAGATLRQVRISLQRSYRGHCQSFSGRLERFVKAKCHSSSFFSVGSAASFSYLLPARLPVGSYTYKIEAVDIAGRVTALASGVSQVRFDVR